MRARAANRAGTDSSLLCNQTAMCRKPECHQGGIPSASPLFDLVQRDGCHEQTVALRRVGALALLANTAFADNLSALIQAAKKEGELNVIALPHDWCGYGGLIAGFKAKYGIKVNELNPDAGSADELEAIKANKNNKARRRRT